MKSIVPKFVLNALALAALLTVDAWAQNDAAALERVLSQMDAAAKTFRSAQANVVWEQYDSVIKESDTQKGRVYFRREGSDIQMAADFFEPAKYVIYSGGKVQVYQPKIEEVKEYDAGKNRSDVESFLVLGFGGAGHDLQRSYDVKEAGSENVNNVSTQKLELTPKSAHLRNNIARILLWIDPARGVSVQQQFFEPGGNYRLVKYSDVQINQKIPANVFKLKTTPRTKVISPQGKASPVE